MPWLTPLRTLIQSKTLLCLLQQQRHLERNITELTEYSYDVEMRPWCLSSESQAGRVQTPTERRLQTRVSGRSHLISWASAPCLHLSDWEICTVSIGYISTWQDSWTLGETPSELPLSAFSSFPIGVQEAAL